MNKVSNISLQEKRFEEFNHRAEDFLKIELYRPALKWLIKARNLGIDTITVDQKIEDCKDKIRNESRIIGIVPAVAFAVVIILIIALYV
jgi:hypothetical protein